MLKIFILHGHVSNKGGVVNFHKNIIPFFDNERLSIKQLRNGRIEKNSLFNYLPLRLMDLIFNYLSFCCLVIIHKPAIIHLNPSIDKKSIYRDFIYLSLTRLFNKPTKIISHFHGWNSKIFKERTLLNKILNKFLDKSDHIIVLGEIFKTELLNQNVEENKISVITTAINVKLFESQKKLIKNNSTKFQLLFLSRILEDKGVFVLLDAINEIVSIDSKSNFSFVIAGDGKDRHRLETRVKELNLDVYVSFPGYVREDEKNDLIFNSDVFIFPSFYGEGCPVAVLEAMAAGLPLITTCAGALREIIQDNVNGLLIDKKDSKQIVKAINILAKDKLLREKMGEENRKKAASEFDAQIISKKIENIYFFLSDIFLKNS